MNRLRRRLSSATACALAPGGCRSVPRQGRLPIATRSSPCSNRFSCPVTISGLVKRSHMPSRASQSRTWAGGSLIGVASTPPRPNVLRLSASSEVSVYGGSPSSTTRPDTLTRSPRRTRGSLPFGQTTNRASEVRGSRSEAPAASCRKKPPSPVTKLPVTTPWVSTSWPSYGLRALRPWICPMCAGGLSSSAAAAPDSIGWQAASKVSASQPPSSQADGWRDENAAPRAALSFSRMAARLISDCRASTARSP